MGEILGHDTADDHNDNLAPGPKSETQRRAELLDMSVAETIELEERRLSRERKRNIGHGVTIAVRMLPPRRAGTARMGRAYR